MLAPKKELRQTLRQSGSETIKRLRVSRFSGPPHPVYANEVSRHLRAMALTTLKSRDAFLRVRGGRRCQNVAFVLEAKKRPPTGRLQSSPQATPSGESPHFGFIITKRLGNAVMRNRIRRRLKHALSDLAEQAAKPDFDYVVIARQRAATQPFANLKKDLERCLQRVHDPQRVPRPSQKHGRSG